MNHTLWEIIEMGGIPMWTLVAFSVLAVAVGLERLTAHWGFVNQARNLAETVTRCLTRGAFAEGRTACERSASPLADVYLVGYERYGRGAWPTVVGAVHRERQRVSQDLKRWVWILGTIGATAPFIGLFGTVVGVIGAFGDIEASGGQGGFGVVSGSIAEALYVTAAGIGVAVEAVIIYNFLNQRMARYAQELKLLTDEFLEVLSTHGPESTGERERVPADDDAAKPEEAEETRGTRNAA